MTYHDLCYYESSIPFSALILHSNDYSLTLSSFFYTLSKQSVLGSKLVYVGE